MLDRNAIDAFEKMAFALVEASSDAFKAAFKTALSPTAREAFEKAEDSLSIAASGFMVALEMERSIIQRDGTAESIRQECGILGAKGADPQIGYARTAWENLSSLPVEDIDASYRETFKADLGLLQDFWESNSQDVDRLVDIAECLWVASRHCD